MTDSLILLNKPCVKIEHNPDENILVFEISKNGVITTKDILKDILKKYPDITCVGFVGEEKDFDKALYFCKYIKLTTNLNTVWYNGTEKISIDKSFRSLKWLDYVFMKNLKIGVCEESDGSYILKMM